jgi:sarcosine oxidase
VVVVGGGLLGLSTAWALRGRRDVLVLERETIGHSRGGSHGPSRIFRLGYADPHYVEMAQRSGELWSRLERESRAALLHPAPQLTFGPGADAVFNSLDAAGVAVQRLGAADVAARFPAFARCGDAVLETTSAVVAADRALAALRVSCDAEIREGVRVLGVDAEGVETEDGRVDARAVVVCAGPWSRALVPSLPTTATLESVAYFRPGRDWPIFIDFAEPAVYGLPTPGVDEYKVALHHAGPVVDPESPYVASDDAVAALQDAIARRFLGVEVHAIDVCPYDNTPDESFVVDRIDGVVVGAGTSGHAFKFGPLLGARLAALVVE